MNNVILLNDWPKPSSVPEPRVFADESKLIVRYFTFDDSVAIITFPQVIAFQFGSPNDERLDAHPLYKNGLDFYSVHKVDDSSWIRELAKRNGIYFEYDQKDYMKDKIHYIFTFHDSTLECAVTDSNRCKSVIRVCKSDEADWIWKHEINA